MPFKKYADLDWAIRAGAGGAGGADAGVEALASQLAIVG